MKILIPDYSGVVEHAQELATKQNDVEGIRTEVVDRVLHTYELFGRMPGGGSWSIQDYRRKSLHAMLLPEKINQLEFLAIVADMPAVSKRSTNKYHRPYGFISELIQTAYQNGLNDFYVDIRDIDASIAPTFDKMYSLHGTVERPLSLTIKTHSFTHELESSTYIDLRVIGKSAANAQKCSHSTLYFTEQETTSAHIYYPEFEESVNFHINAGFAHNCTIYVPSEEIRHITQLRTTDCDVHVITDELLKEISP